MTTNMNDTLNVLVFDTETTGLIEDFKTDASQRDLQKEPFVVQLAYVIAKIDMRTLKVDILKQVNQLIKPYRTSDSNFDTMPEQAFNVHHHSFDDCVNDGIDMKLALQTMQQDCQEHNCTCMVAHNARYDTTMLDFESVRCSFERFMLSQHIVCTQRLSKPFAQAAAIGANLMDIYRHFVGHEFENAHDAFADVLACLQVFVSCCARVGVWPVKNSVLAIQAYSNGYHQSIPSWHQPNSWNDCAQIDCVMLDDVERQHVLFEKHLYIKLPLYDETACKEYNVDINKCKAGYTPQIAMQLLAHFIQCANVVVVHGAKFQLSIMHSMFVKYHVHDAFLLKQFVVDSNLLACWMYPQLAANMQYVTRDDLWSWFHKGQKPTIEVSAALSIAINFACMIAQPEITKSYMKSLVWMKPLT